MGLDIHKWIEDLAERPPLSIAIVLTFTFLLGKFGPAKSSIFISAILGAVILYTYQAIKDWHAARFSRVSGEKCSGTAEDGARASDDESWLADSADGDQADDKAERRQRRQSEGDSEDNSYSYEYRDEASQKHPPSCFWLDGSEGGEAGSPCYPLLGDWLENLKEDLAQPNGEAASLGGAAGHGFAGAGEDSSPEKSDPMNKARLDLLFRYLSSMDGGGRSNEQGAVTAQRQKLQRKLLQRAAGGEVPGAMKGNKATKNGAKAEGSGNNSVTVTDAEDKTEDLLEDSVKVEELLRELGESHGSSVSKTPSSVSKAQGPSKRARRKGAPFASPASKEPSAACPDTSQQSAASSTQPAAAKAASVDATRAPSASTRLGGATVGSAGTAEASTLQVPNSAKNAGEAAVVAPEASLAEAPDSDYEAHDPKEFQVVANKKGRKKGRKDVAVESSTASALGESPSAAEPCSPGVSADAQVTPDVAPTSHCPSPKAKAATPGAAVEAAKTEKAAATSPARAAEARRPAEVSKAADQATAWGRLVTAAPVSAADASLAAVAKAVADAEPSRPVESGEAERESAASPTEKVAQTVLSTEPDEASKANVAKAPRSGDSAAKPRPAGDAAKAAQSRREGADADSGTIDGEVGCQKEAEAAASDAKESGEATSAEEETAQAAEPPLEGGAQTSECAKEEEFEEDDEDWEWQCPDGFRLQPYVCPEPLLCASCGETQPKGSSVLRAEESGWAACEECIRIAWGQPVVQEDELPHNAAEPSVGVVAESPTVDPSRMTTLEIAAWFQERGAEGALRQCMLQVLAGENARPEAKSAPGQVAPAQAVSGDPAEAGAS